MSTEPVSHMMVRETINGALIQMRELLERAIEADELDERLDVSDAPQEFLQAQEALNRFLDKLWTQSFELSAKHEMLEKVVEIRTNQVHEILDNVDTGFLLTLFDETVLDNFSRSCAKIFGEADLKGKILSELMELSESKKAVFSLSYQQIFEGLLPPEVSIAQLPREFSINGRNYSITGTPISDRAGKVTKVFFTINDNTELRKAEAENALRQALIDIVRQKESFSAFLRETSRAFASVRASPNQLRFRNLLHTLKGNLGCYGLQEIAELVHSIEEAPLILDEYLDLVENTLRRFLVAQRSIIGLDYPDPHEVSKSWELERLRPQLQEIIAEPSHTIRLEQLEELLKRSSWVEAGALFAPLQGVFDRVVARLEKVARLEVKGAQILVDPDRVSTVFSNLGHLIRNSVDHGLEPAHERGTKPECGLVTMSCAETPTAWNIEVFDDGRGIDVDAIGQAAILAQRISVDALNELDWEQRARLLFLDGLSTKQVASIDSGRGVGMSALLESVESVGGSIHLLSAPRQGTTVRIEIPKSARPLTQNRSRHPTSIHEPLGDRASIACSLAPPNYG